MYVRFFGLVCLVHLCEVHLCTQAHTPIVPANHCNTTKLSTPSEARWSSFWLAEQPQHCGANSCKCSQKKKTLCERDRERESSRARERERVCVWTSKAEGELVRERRWQSEREGAGEGERERGSESGGQHKNFQWNVIGNLIFLVPL